MNPLMNGATKKKPNSITKRVVLGKSHVRSIIYFQGLVCLPEFGLVGQNIPLLSRMTLVIWSFHL